MSEVPVMLIQNTTVLSPGTGETYRADLRIWDGKIAQIAAPYSLSPLSTDEEFLDASSCVTAPGLVDVHVHFRDPGFTYKEDLHTGARSAAAGGVTTVICMANTRPAVDNPGTLSDLLARAKDEKIRIHFAAAVTKGLQGKELTDFEKLAALGAVGFTDDGIALTDGDLVREAMTQARKLSLPLSFHEEDPGFITKSGRNDTAPAVAEETLVLRDVSLAEETGAVINIQHVSSAGSVNLIREAKARGAAISAEATPHHFSLTEEAVKRYGTNAKMNPPLRTEADRQAIIEGLKDGTIDLIATDHAPHSTKEKQCEDFFDAPGGIIGLETSLALGITNLVRPGHLSLMNLLAKMTLHPARLYRINPQALPCTVHRAANTPDAAYYGSICPGCAADLVLFNPKESFTAGPYQSKSENTPFTGMKLFGKIHATICRGRIVWTS